LGPYKVFDFSTVVGYIKTNKIIYYELYFIILVADVVINGALLCKCKYVKDKIVIVVSLKSFYVQVRRIGACVIINIGRRLSFYF